MKSITPCLWFAWNAMEAVKFYVSVFPNSKITNVSYYTKDVLKQHGGKPGSVLFIEFVFEFFVFFLFVFVNRNVEVVFLVTYSLSNNNQGFLDFTTTTFRAFPFSDSICIEFFTAPAADSSALALSNNLNSHG